MPVLLRQGQRVSVCESLNLHGLRTLVYDPEEVHRHPSVPTLRRDGKMQADRAAMSALYSTLSMIGLLCAIGWHDWWRVENEKIVRRCPNCKRLEAWYPNRGWQEQTAIIRQNGNVIIGRLRD